MCGAKRSQADRPLASVRTIAAFSIEVTYGLVVSLRTTSSVQYNGAAMCRHSARIKPLKSSDRMQPVSMLQSMKGHQVHAASAVTV